MNEQKNAIKQGAREVRDEAELAARDIGQQAKRDAREVKHALSERASKEAQWKTDAVARETKTLAHAMQRAAEEAEREESSFLTGPLSQIAAYCDELSESVEGKDPREILSDVEDFGRREPAAFFGAAVAVGFLTTRFMRAGAQPPQEEEPEQFEPSEPEASSEYDAGVQMSPEDVPPAIASGSGTGYEV
ncbi:MAG: hypothetical protein ACOC1F_07465 [Myxococcota bacterium]